MRQRDVALLSERRISRDRRIRAGTQSGGRIYSESGDPGPDLGRRGDHSERVTAPAAGRGGARGRGDRVGGGGGCGGGWAGRGKSH